MIITPFVLEWVLKGVGSGAVATIVENRKDGKQIDFDLAANRFVCCQQKAIENLLAEDLIFLGTTRAQYFHDDGDGILYEKAIRYGVKFQENENLLK
jgi:DNA polymerase-3 subunit alpha